MFRKVFKSSNTSSYLHHILVSSIKVHISTKSQLGKFLTYTCFPETQHQTINILVGVHSGTSNNIFMKSLSFYRQQILLPVDGMQNSHHWYVMLARATTRLLINSEGSKSNNACTVYLRYHHTIGKECTLVRPELAKSSLIVEHQRKRGKRPYSASD